MKCVHLLHPRLLALGLVLALAASALAVRCVRVDPPPAAADADVVVLLHGLARRSGSMRSMERALARAGYRVINLDYPSRKKTIERLVAEDLAPALEERLGRETAPVHFVTHSMGGILVRAYLRAPPPFTLGRVVMLAPPNTGSELPDKLGWTGVFSWVNGPAGMQLTTGPDGVPGRLLPPTYPVGVIAGTRSLNPLYSALIPGRDDGKVSVERAKLAGMADFLALPYSHTWLMARRAVQRQTIIFLESGAFSR